MNKVKLYKGHLDYFRKLARQTPLEILAYLIGSVKSPMLTVVDSFEYTKAYGKQDAWNVAWTIQEYDRVAKKAEERGKRIIGFIHSHPSWDAVLSSADYEICVTEGSRLCGIVSTDKRKTRVRFWTMESSLPCKIIYAKKKAAPECSE